MSTNLSSSSTSLDSETKASLEKAANTIRVLSMDAVQKADSGHPGLPMGCAEIGAFLYGCFLHHAPKNPHFANRDRVVLSAGHGSMWLYSCLHLSGFDLSLEDIKHFRQLHSKTPGHPEYRETPGVETTSGPLGQGLGNAVGQALGLKCLAARFNTPEISLFDSKVYVLMGDGCVMEGVTSEVSSLAGHLQLDNLIAIYDANHVSLDGPLSDSCSENTRLRYEAYGWEVFEMQGNDIDDVARVLTLARQDQKKPRLIIATTTIGKGSPHKAGSSKAHGSPLGVEEIKETKEILGVSQEPFFVPPSVYEFFKKKEQKDEAFEDAWTKKFEEFAKNHPDKFREYEAMKNRRLPDDLEDKLNALQITSPIAGRKASQDVLNAIATYLPQLIGGSADLSSSDLTMLKNYPVITSGRFEGRNIKFGVREFGMATMATGLYETEFFTPFIGTFLTFSDYMRNAIRLAALMHVQVIYQFTHDSIFLGEDGPTHQPVEHYAALRAIPFLQVIRPADANEVKMSWIAALRYNGPTALLLTRQNLPELPGTKRPYAEGLGRGAYILKKEGSKPDFTLIATGSEVSLALEVADQLEKIGKAVRVVSMPCWEIFENQPLEYRQEVLGGNIGKRVSLEAGVELGWHKYIGMDGVAIAIDSFGASAPIGQLKKEFGFTVESVLERIL